MEDAENSSRESLNNPSKLVKEKKWNKQQLMCDSQPREKLDINCEKVQKDSLSTVPDSSAGDGRENLSLYDKHNATINEGLDVNQEAIPNLQQLQSTASSENTRSNEEIISEPVTNLISTPGFQVPPTDNARQSRNNLPPTNSIPQEDLGQRIHRLNVRDRHGVFMNYLFLNLTVRYITYFKSTSRRLIEFFSLLNALLMFIVLLYIHYTFVRSSGDCLNHVKDIWPQSGILRVQISYNITEPGYQLLFSKNNIPSSVRFQSTPYNAVFQFSSPIFPKDIVDYKLWKSEILSNLGNYSEVNNTENVCRNINLLNHYRNLHFLKGKCPLLKEDYIKELKLSFSSVIASVLSDMTIEYQNTTEISGLLDDSSRTVLSSSQKILAEILEYDPFEPPSVREFYAIEYSTEFGYLRLSTKARYKLGIPTLIVNLNPDVDECFGNGPKKFMLKTFLGYDDFLMSSIKKVAESGKSQGYLRNCVTGEYFRFVTVWISHSSSIIAFAVMIIFTLTVSMLLRYSYQQIFMFMMEVLRIFDTDIRLVFPAAPMLTIVLALVGMEEIMTEFFHDSTVAFYVILLIWSADQFDVICLHTVVSRRHWVRFFFLYHFAFYVYNYKFNGQYSKLALFTSWLFIFHSMVYFYHHYEIPAIQRQMVLVTQRNRSANRGNPPEPENTFRPEHSPSSDERPSLGEREPASPNVPSSESNRDLIGSGPGRTSSIGRPIDGTLNFWRCYLRLFNNVYLPYICSFVLIAASLLIAAFIYSTLSWPNHSLQIAPLASR